MFGRTTFSSILSDVHLWDQKHQTTKTKITTQQPQLQMLIFHDRQ